MVGAHEPGMGHPARAGELEHLLAEGDDVVGDPGRLVGGIETPHEPFVLRRHAGRAVSRMAALGLDTADGHHRLPSDVDQVAA